MAWYRWEGEALHLYVSVRPRAAKDAVVGVQGERLKLCLRSPPVDGQANAQLLRFLAEAFGVPRAQVSLLSGQRSREKHCRILRPGQPSDALPPALRPRLQA